MYYQGKIESNEALGLIVEYWFREIVEKTENGHVQLRIENDGQIEIGSPS